MMKYNTLIFDLDVTLLDSLDDIVDSINYALEKLDYPLKTKEEISSFAEDEIERLIELSLPDKTSYDKFAKCLILFKTHYSKNIKNKTKPYNGIIELLEYLKKNKYKIAVVSNKLQNEVTELNNYYFSQYIQLAIGKSSKIRKKPYPDTVLKVIDDLGVCKEKCLYIGNSKIDFEAAKSSKIDFVGASWGCKDKNVLNDLGVNYIIDNPKDIISILIGN